MLDLIIPNWPAPSWVKAATTTRRGGFSHPPFDSLNLGLHVGDSPEEVAKNQKLLENALGLNEGPLWLKQVHGTKVISADAAPSHPIADAIYSKKSNVVCAVQTADCLPLLICSYTRPCIVAIHAGWRGLAAGIIKNSVAALNCPTHDLLAWLGPAIGPRAFIVGKDVVNAFVEKDPETNAAFQFLGKQRWLANLYQLAKRHLNLLGINAIFGANYCTYTHREQFFSFRRDGVTGRMASLIWIDPQSKSKNTSIVS